MVVIAVSPSGTCIRPPSTINLGLDLQGGIHLVLGVDVDKALEAQVERAGDTAQAELEKRGIGVTRVERRGTTELVVQLASRRAGTRRRRRPTRSCAPSTGRKPIRPPAASCWRSSRARPAHIRDLAVRQGLETIRNRVDQFGVAEPSIQQQGENRILVQLPGVQDPGARQGPHRQDRAARVQAGGRAHRPGARAPDRAARRAPRSSTSAGWTSETREERKVPFLVQKKAAITGGDVTTARVSIDQNTSEPYVSVEFNAAGARAFSELTDANVGKRLAIVLDGNVHSAPQIRERIPPGGPRSRAASPREEATDLAIVLRAGALPAPVQVLEERTVGPSLGADSIRQGIVAILASTALVFLFMLVYYRLSGAHRGRGAGPQPAAAAWRPWRASTPP